MKVGFLGSGAWGITLANLIANNGHEVLLWSIEEDVLESLKREGRHPKFPEFKPSPTIQYTADLQKLLEGDIDIIVECVTAKGFRSICTEIKERGGLKKPLILTSKGIEQGSDLLLVEVAYEMFGNKDLIGYLSGPTLAKEVMLGHPTSAVASSTDSTVIQMIRKLFDSSTFRVYINRDIYGVALGGAIKNVIAIASGLAEGLGFGHNTKAFVITRGLQEMCKIAKVKGAKKETCFGLSGIGDLIVTGVSDLSRNYSFGALLGAGFSVTEAKAKVGMVVEGEYTVLSAYEIARKHALDLPIIEGIYKIIYEGRDPKKTFFEILEREADNCVEEFE